MGTINYNIKEELRKDDYPYDSAFKTVMKECKSLVYHLLNETFGECCDKDDEIIFLNDEHELIKGTGRAKEEAESFAAYNDKIISDTNFIVRDKDGNVKGRYIYECQSKKDDTMTVRMVRYGARVAFENFYVKDGVLHIPFPEAAVLYLRGQGNNEADIITAKVDFPDCSVDYNIKSLRFQRYSIDELFEKKLYVLLPFSLFLYEGKLKTIDKDENERNKIVDLYRDIITRLDSASENGELDSYQAQEICLLLEYVTDSLAAKYDNVRNEVDKVMGGRLLEFDITKVKNEYVNQGREAGLRDGREEGLRDGLNEGQILGTMETLRYYGEKDEKIIDIVCERFHLTEDKAKQYLAKCKKDDGAEEA